MPIGLYSTFVNTEGLLSMTVYASSVWKQYACLFVFQFFTPKIVHPATAGKVLMWRLTHLYSERPKEAWRFWKYFPYKSIFWETFDWEMLIRRQTINLLQIFYEISPHSQVIFKSKKVADDISRGTLECEWVNTFLIRYISGNIYFV